MALWALVTGASEGLGREFAILAAKSGFDVILTARQEDKLQKLSHELQRAYHVDVKVFPADLTDPEAVEQLWRDACEGRQIAVLVNNAGLGSNGPFADEGNWHREVDSVSVNVVAATILLKRAVGYMVAAGSGQVLNVASVASFMAGPQMAVYYATKAYFLNLSEAVAAEVKASGVGVTALCPGATATQFFAAGDFEKTTWLAKFPKPSAAEVAQAGWKGMEARKRIVVPGVMNKAFVIFAKLAPRPVLTWINGQLAKRR